MNSSLKKLRRKYIITASAIVFAVMLLMTAALNLLMRAAYSNEKETIVNIIEQTAASHINQPVTERFILSEAEQTDSGDYIIPRNVRDISSITVYGNISCSDSTATWYSAGGGLMFEADTETENAYVYKDYSFSRGTKSVSIDFEDYDNIKSDYDIISIDESQIIGDYFLVSVVWWKNSSTVPDGTDDNITLSIDSIEINYKSRSSIASSGGTLVAHSSFSDVFEDHIPEILNNTSAFYFVAGDSGNLISINDGNLINTIDNDEAEKYTETILNSGESSGSIEKDGTAYSYTVYSESGRKIIIFVNDSLTEKANGNLLKISVLVSAAVWIVLVILIIMVSGRVVKPVADSMKRQEQFISDASHELKTPITVISATADIIAGKTGNTRWIDCIKEQTNKMQRLVTELLDLSRLLEVHTARTGFESADVSETVKNNLLYFEGLLFESGKTLAQDIEDNIIMECSVDKISQLTGILMDNALKYSDEKSEIAFRLKKDKNSVIMQCSNPCSDFTAENTEKLFDRFYRSDNDHSREQEGFGLGLSIAQAIAALHGGKISASYEKNIITFTVVFPI